MWREDLVLLRSHQDLADVTNNLVASRLSLQWFFYSTNSLGEIFLFSYIVMLPSVPMMSRTFLEHFISLNFIFQCILWPTKKSLLKPHLSPLLPRRHPSLCSAAASPRAHRGRWAGWRRRRTSRAPKASSLPSASRTSRWSACCFPGDACQWKCYRYLSDARDDEFIKLNMFNCSPEEDKVGIFFADHFLAHGVADIWKNQQTWGDC